MNNYKGFAHVLLLILVVGALILFSPSPYWVSSSEFVCLSLDCPKHGLNWGSSLFTRLLNNESLKDKYYVSDLDSCTVIEYRCPDGYRGFVDDEGCGCEKDFQENLHTTTSEWKTYSNEQFGFTIKLPWDIELINETETSLEFGTYPPSEIPYLIFTNNLSDYSQYQSKTINIHGVDFDHYDVSDNHNVVQSSKQQIEIQWKPQFENTWLFEKILSTIEFTD